MKRTLSIVLTVVMLVAMIPLSSLTAFATSNTIVSVENVSAILDSTVDVSVSISGNPGIASMGFTLTFDEDLTLVGASNGEAFSEMTLTPPAQLKKVGYVNDSCRFAWLGNENVTENGTILNLKFKVAADAQLNKDCFISITCDHGDVLDDTRTPVDVEISNGKVTIIDYTPGDVDGDSNITMMDVLTLCQFYVDGCKYDPNGYGINIKSECGDVDANGKVNMIDVLMICQYYVDGCKYDPEGYGVILLPGKAPCEHILEKTEELAPTCTEDGNIAYWHCAKCGEYYRDANASNVISLESTVVKAKGHTIVVDSAVPATYESTGLTEGSHCSVCNEVFVAQDTIPKLKKQEYSIEYYIVGNDEYLASIDIQYPEKTSYTSDEGVDWLEELVVSGYNFEGWFDGQGSAASRVTSIPVGTARNIKLYAKWTKEPYTVQFESDLVPVSSIEYTVDKGATLPVPHLDGYTFVGWSNGDGEILKVIPVGTTGNKTYIANWLSERNKAWTKKTLDDPIIIEDEEPNRILFTYEIGQIENVPLYEIENFGYINSEGVSKTVSKTYTVKTSKTLMDQYAQNVANATTNSSQWSLSSGWSNAVTVNESYLTENNMSETDAKTLCTTDSSNWLISSGSSGSTTTTTYASSQDYDLNTATGNTKTYDTHDESSSKTHKQSAELDIKYEHKSGLISKTAIGENNFSVEANVGYEGSRTSSSASKTGTETDAGSSDQTGNIKHTGTDTVSTGSWNSSSSYGGSKSVSESNSVSKTISERIASEKGYGRSYIDNGGETNTQGLSTSSSNSNTYSSAVTYGTEESATETVEYTTSNTKTGYHRYIKAGTAHVFAVVCYDIKTATYSVLTYTVMDDEMHNFEDYSYQSAAYNDNQSGVITFEVPYSVEEYVLSKVGETDGLEVNSAGIITGYSGSETTVIIPEYRVVDNLDGTKKVLKIIGISSTAFAGNTAITGIQLSDFITEIPDNAFEGCTSLESIDMSCVQSIGKEAFKDCTSINYVFLNEDVVSLGDNAFDNIETFAVYTKNINIINGAINSGAKNILIYTCDGCSALNDQKLSISDGTETFVFNGRGNEYTNLSISSNAQNTIINNCKITSTIGLPLKISSENVQLGQIDVSSTGIALILSGNSCNLGLYGESKVSTSSDNAMVGKNITISKTEDAIKKGVFSELEVKGNVLVCGTKTGTELMNCDGNVITIDEETFQNYVNGMYQLTFNANEGTVSETTKTVFYGLSCGELPVPSRQYYTFDGWFTAVDGGVQFTEDYIYDATQNTVLYAHWTRNSFVVTFNANGGTVATLSQRGYCGVALGELPTPTRDYYTFNGWFTAIDGGTKITSSAVYDVAQDITLYAHWTLNPVIGWVRASEKPNDAQLVGRKWTYTLTETKESTESYLDGWSQTGNYWKQTGTGSKKYASFPSGFDTSNSIYTSFAKSPYEAYTNANTKREVSNSHKGYIYYKWDYNAAYANRTDRTISSKRLSSGSGGYAFIYFYAHESSINHPYLDNYYCNSQNVSCYNCSTEFNTTATAGASPRFCRFDYYISTYTDYSKIYQYKKITNNIEATNNPTGQNGVSNVVEWVQYRVK